MNKALGNVHAVYLPSTLIRHKNRAFRKHSWNRRIWKRKFWALMWRQKILKNKIFKNEEVKIILWFPLMSCRQTQIQNDWCLFRFQFFFLA